MTPQQTRTRRRRRAGAFWGGAGLLVLGVGLGVALQFQAAAAATGSSGTVTTSQAGGKSGTGNQGNGLGNGLGNPAKTLAVSGTASADLGPGRDAVLSVTVTNPNSGAVVLTSVEATVTSVTPVNGLRCDADWISVPAGGQGVEVPGGGTRTVALAVKLSNLPAVNQDGCKGAGYTYSLTANGRQA
jgi:hypothetical protein